MGPGIGSSSPGVIGHGSMTSMGSAPTPRNLMSANAFVSAQGLHNRNLSDLGSYLELLSLSAGQEQVLVTSPPERIASCRLPFRLQCFVVWGLTCCRAASVDIVEAASPPGLLPASCSMRLFIISGKHSPSCLIWRVVFHNPCDLVTPAGAWSGVPFAAARLAAAAPAPDFACTAAGALCSFVAASRPLSAPVSPIHAVAAPSACNAGLANPSASNPALQKSGRLIPGSGDPFETISFRWPCSRA